MGLQKLVFLRLAFVRILARFKISGVVLKLLRYFADFLDGASDKIVADFFEI